MERLWIVKEVNGSHVILPKQPMYCPVCGSPLLLHDFRAYRHRYPEGQPELRHCDVHMKCIHCGLWLTFGVPITYEELEKLQKSKYHGKTLRWELREIYREEYKAVEKRLEALGYW